MQSIFSLGAESREGLYDITDRVSSFVLSSGVKTGFVNVCVQGTTAAVMIVDKFFIDKKLS
jgi:thiamine phosphate synthase YjbQ (UPF0047 family)